MSKISVWNIHSDFHKTEILSHINNNEDLHKTHLLDMSKCNYTLMEKIAYDIATFHLQRLNVKNPKKYHVEFYCKTKMNDINKQYNCDNELFVNHDKQTRKNRCYYYPILSSITYLNEDSNNATIISNIDIKDYMYKSFENHKNITLSIPVTNKHITFDGHYYHGNVALNENANNINKYELHVNIWDKPLNNVDFYIPNADCIEPANAPISFEIDNSMCNIKVSEDIINFNFFNTLLYDKTPDVCYRFNELINNSINQTTVLFEVDTNLKLQMKLDKLKNIHVDSINDIMQIKNAMVDIKYNRFLQRFTFNNVYSHDLSSYIINECEMQATQNNGWEKLNSTIKTISVMNIPSLFGIVKTTIDNTIMNKITNSYNLHNFDTSADVLLDVVDVVVVKYDDQNSLKMHKNSGFFTFYILLNNDFTGGGIYFDDGLNVYLKQGDMLIHNSHIKHSILPITKGICYMLVGFVDLEISIK